MFVNDWLLLNYKTSPQGELQFGWTIPKGVGGAVVRNRYKRWLREYFQSYLQKQSLEKQEDSANVQLQVVLYGKNSDMMSELERSKFFDILQSGISKLERVLKRQGQN